MALPRLIFLATIFFLASAGVAAAQDAPDTEANRRQAAEEYLQVQPVEEMMQDMANELTARMPEERQAELRRMMTEEVRYDTLKAAIIDVMANHFTVSEIKALTQFYSTPEGRSVMEKMSAYMAEVQPLLSGEIRRAMQKSMESNRGQQ